MIIPLALSYLWVVTFQSNDKRGQNPVTTSMYIISFFAVAGALILKHSPPACLVMLFASAVGVLIAENNNNALSKIGSVILFGLSFLLLFF